jgi:hypothetical protein
MTFGAPLLVFSGWLVVERLVGKTQLTSYERALRSKGEKLTIAELIPADPEGENGGPEVIRLCGTLQDGKVVPIEAPPPQMRMVAPGKAMRGAAQSRWLTLDKNKVITNNWEVLAKDLEINEQTLDALRTALGKPVLCKRLNYEAGLKHLDPTHLMRLKRAAQWLSASSVHQMHLGNATGALKDIEALVALLRMQESEQLAINQLVRWAVHYFAVASTWEVLEGNGWDDQSLERIQAAWAGLNFIDPVVDALRMERALGRLEFDEARHSVDAVAEEHASREWLPVVDAFTGSSRVSTVREKAPLVDSIVGFIEKDAPETVWKGVLYPLWQFAWSHRDERQSWLIFQTLIDWTKTARQQHSAATLQKMQMEMAGINQPSGLNRLRFLLSPMIGTMCDLPERGFQAQAQAELAVCAIALKRYQLRHGKYPNRLDDLVPEFLAERPIDYMDGGKLRYRLEGGDFVLWSVGVDGKDESGDPGTLDKEGKPKQMWKSPDAVWPRPASETEIREYEKRRFGN